MNTDVELRELANKFGLELAVVKAVKEVESGNSEGFLKDGRPQILFEGHIFYRYLVEKYGEAKVKKYVIQYPKLVYRTWTKIYYLGSVREHDERLSVAAKIDRECALKATSFGMFQIMGFNYKLCGCNTLQEFVNCMYKSKSEQIRLFFNFIKNQNMLGYLVNKQWAKFARAYNGPGYKANKYDTKLETLYNKYKQQEK